MHRFCAILCGAITLVAAGSGVLGETPAAVQLAVIVHPARQVQLRTEDLARIFLKQRRFWDDNEPIVPLNREPGSAAREVFSRRVLGDESARFGEYWNRQYFQGVFPPATLSSDAAVKRYVAVDRNAIGYISVGEVDDSVRVVLRLE